MSRIEREISNANRVSRGWHWRFWKNEELRTRDSLAALDRIELAAREEHRPALVEAVEVTRNAYGQSQELGLTTLQTAFTAMASMQGLPGFALQLSQVDPQLHPVLYDEVSRRRPGWEADFLKTVGVEDLAGLHHLADDQPWALPRAAEFASAYPGTRSRAIDQLRKLEEHPAFQAFDELSHEDYQEALEVHLLKQFGPPYEPLSWSREFFETRTEPKERKRVADWTLNALPDQPWKSFWKKAPMASVGIVEQLHGQETLNPKTALQATRAQPELLDQVLELAREQKNEGWSQALELTQKLPPQIREAAVDHLLGPGTQGLERAALQAAAPGPQLLAVSHTLLEAQPESGLKSFLVSLKHLPFENEESRSRVLARGTLQLPQKQDSASELALLACKSCDATDQISDKFSVLQHGLTTLHQSVPEGWPKAAVEMAWRIAHQPAADNQLWLRTAAAHQALRMFSRSVPSSEAELVDFGRQMFQAQWMVPEWHSPVYQEILGTLSAQTTDGWLTEGLSQLSSDDMLENLKHLKAVVEVASLGESGPDETDLEVGEGYVTVGDYEVPIDGHKSRAEVEVNTPARVPTPTPGTGLTPDYDYSDEERAQKVIIRREEAYKRGTALLYNPARGDFDYQESYKRGVAGAYLPFQGASRFEEGYKRGMAVVYHPETAEVQFEEEYKRGYSGLRNPVTGEVGFQEKYKGGVAAAVDPYTGEERWEDGYKRGVTGLYRLDEERFQFENAYKRGLSLATNDPGHPTLTTSSSWSMDFDED